jgi:hypothetical protein
VNESPVRKAARALWIAIAGAAVLDAIRSGRLHGEVFGFVPYDFRPPTVERARERTWNPRSKRILTPITFGVGWSLNLGRLARIAHLT